GRAKVDGRETQGHQIGDPVGNRARLRALSDPALQSRRHRKREEDPGWVQGATALAVPGQAVARVSARGGFHQAANRGAGADVASVLQRVEFHSAVLSDQSRRKRAYGTIREDWRWRGQIV